MCIIKRIGLVVIIGGMVHKIAERAESARPVPLQPDLYKA
jgi:hypothetical protein